MRQEPAFAYSRIAGKHPKLDAEHSKGINAQGPLHVVITSLARRHVMTRRCNLKVFSVIGPLLFQPGHQPPPSSTFTASIDRG